MNTAPKTEVLVSARTAAKVVLVVFVMIALRELVLIAGPALLLIVISLFLAIALGPAVDFFQNRSRIPRWLSILVVYFFLAAAIVLIGLLVVPPIVTGVQALADDIPNKVEELRNTGWIRYLDTRYHVVRN